MATPSRRRLLTRGNHGPAARYLEEFRRSPGLGGWAHIFGTAQTHFAAINPATKKPFGAFVPTAKATGSTQLDFATLALGSALALFLYRTPLPGR